MPDHATGRPLASIKVINMVASPLADMVLYFASDASRHVTDAQITSDDGQML